MPLHIIIAGLPTLNRDKIDRAIEDWSTAINLDPNYALAYNNRGTAYFSKGKINRAIENYSKSDTTQP